MRNSSACPTACRRRVLTRPRGCHPSRRRSRTSAPAGFEQFFRELSERGGAINADPGELTALGARYRHHFKVETVPELVERFGLRIREPLSGGWTP
ncbi:MAG: hypothetical protein ACJ74P_15250 [Gaiellaceae bacterium]